MKIPFTTSAELKDAMSGVDLALDLENIKSSLDRVPNDLIEVIGLTVYNEMIAHYTEPKTVDTEVWDELVTLCRKAMFPMALYKHFIWLQVRVSNAGVTTMKGQNETTAYKYQTDEAKESLLDSWGDFVSQIIDHLNASKDVITQWPLTTQYAAQSKKLFSGYRDFCRVANIRPADAAYYIRVSDIINDVTADEVETIIDDISALEATDKKLRKAQKFVMYRVLSLSAIQFDISAMPKPMRQVMINEMNGKNGQSFDYVKGKLSGFYKQEAENWLQKLSNDILADAKSADTEDLDKEMTSTTFTEDDKAVGIC